MSNICIKIEEINNVLAEQMMRLLQIRICTLKASTSKTCEKNSDNYTHTILPSYNNAMSDSEGIIAIGLAQNFTMSLTIQYWNTLSYGSYISIILLCTKFA